MRAVHPHASSHRAGVSKGAGGLLRSPQGAGRSADACPAHLQVVRAAAVFDRAGMVALRGAPACLVVACRRRLPPPPCSPSAASSPLFPAAAVSSTPPATPGSFQDHVREKPENAALKSLTLKEFTGLMFEKVRQLWGAP